MTSLQKEPFSIQRAYYWSMTLVASCGVIWVILQLAQYFSTLTLTLGLVILFAYMLLAPVNILDRLLNRPLIAIAKHLPTLKLNENACDKMSRALSILTVYFTVFILILFLSLRFVPMTLQELGAFLGEAPDYLTRAETWLVEQPWVEKYLNDHNHEANKGKSGIIDKVVVTQKTTQTTTVSSRDTLRAKLEDRIQNFQGIASKQTQSIANGVTGVFGFASSFVTTTLGSTLSAIIYAFAGLVMLFYILLDGKKIREEILYFVPQKRKALAGHILTNFHNVMFGFVKSQVMLGIATGLFMVIVYSYFDVPYALFLGAFFAVSEIVPVVGTWIGFTPGILVLLFLSPAKLLIVMGIVYVYQTLKDNIIAPKVMGDVLGLHPLVIILSLLICGQTGGIIGIIYSIPLASMINAFIHSAPEIVEE